MIGPRAFRHLCLVSVRRLTSQRYGRTLSADWPHPRTHPGIIPAHLHVRRTFSLIESWVKADLFIVAIPGPENKTYIFCKTHRWRQGGDPGAVRLGGKISNIGLADSGAPLDFFLGPQFSSRPLSTPASRGNGIKEKRGKY